MGFYKYYPGTAVVLGGLFDPLMPDVKKSVNDYITWSEEGTTKQSLGGKVQAYSKEVRSYSEMTEAFKMDAALNLKFSLAKISATASWERNTTFSDNTLVYIVCGFTKYNSEEKKGSLRLSKLGKDLWDEKKNGEARDFQRIVGTEVVTDITRGNFVHLIYKFRASSSTFKQKLSATLNAKWSTGNARINFASEVFNLDESLTVEIDTFQSGIILDQPNFAKLTEIYKEDPGDIVAIRAIVEKILSEVTSLERDSSDIVEFTTAEVGSIYDIARSSHFGQYQSALSLNNTINRACFQLYELYIDSLKSHEAIQKLKDKWNGTDFKPGSFELIKSKIEEIDTLLYKIDETFHRVRYANNSTDTKVSIEKIKALNYGDVLMSPFITHVDWHIIQHAQFLEGVVGKFATLIFPVFHIRFLEALDYVYLNRPGKNVMYNRETLKKMFENPHGYISSYDDRYQCIFYEDQGKAEPWDGPHVRIALNWWKEHHLELESNIENSVTVVLRDGTRENFGIGNVRKPVMLYLDNHNYSAGIDMELLNLKVHGMEVVARTRVTPEVNLQNNISNG